MLITTQELIDGIEAKNQYPLDQEQKDAILSGSGPLLIAAGPGTGKTEVLVSRCLKLLLCDGVSPASIIITTFTEKAAKNMQDRLAGTFLHLASLHPSVASIDPSALRIGTIHSICNDVMQEYRYVGYQNLRLLDGVESALLIHKDVVDAIEHLKDDLFSEFDHLFGNRQLNHLSKWDWALALQKLLGRTIEDNIRVPLLSCAGGGWAALAEVQTIYDQILANAHATDFSRLLRHFLNFLDSGQGAIFLGGDGSDVRLPLTHVLVDEYQDTNPIQESIYFRLADSQPHNLTVVGDDDQALYRFRGGTVECIVGFNSVCQQKWNVACSTVYLSNNHRSDGRIVSWCNDYIATFPVMTAEHVRTAGKPPLQSALGVTGVHPGVSHIRQARVTDCADSVAQLLTDMRQNGIIQDYSQCALLLRSTKNSAKFAGPYIAALQSRNIPVYNPRSKDYLEQQEVAECLGALIRILDPQLANVPVPQSTGSLTAKVRNLVLAWVAAYDAMSPSHPALAAYVNLSAQTINNLPANTRITPALPTILFRIMSQTPFSAYQATPDMDLRLSKLTRLFESFCAQYGRELKTDQATGGRLPGWWFGYFYRGFCGYLAQKGLDDDEDEEVVCPLGFFPIMTVHQAKGLEFDVVFSGNLGLSVSESDSHILEEQLRPYRNVQPTVVHATSVACWHDEIRQHFVAFSRAKFALILVATESQLRKSGEETASFGHGGGSWVRQNTVRL